jgi:cytochrome c oxidase cbb3-type subunit III
MKPKNPVLVNILVILALLLVANYTFNENFSFFGSVYFWGSVVIAIVVALIHDSLGDMIENQKFKKMTAEEKAAYIAQKKVPYLQRLYKDAFTKSAEENNVAEIDHGFDGIKELDNSLPKWWLNLFYFGCAFCVCYMVAYSCSSFAHALPEYEAETRTMAKSIEEYNKTVVQPTLDTAENKADNIEEGKQLFATNCVSCHNEGAKGGIGPNLTDKYWINQKAKDVFHNVFWMLENGSPNNATMRAFIKNGEITGLDAEKIAAYIHHINQEQAPITPAQGGAAPQGTVAPWVK